MCRSRTNPKASAQILLLKVKYIYSLKPPLRLESQNKTGLQ